MSLRLVAASEQPPQHRGLTRASGALSMDKGILHGSEEDDILSSLYHELATALLALARYIHIKCFRHDPQGSHWALRFERRRSPGKETGRSPSSPRWRMGRYIGPTELQQFGRLITYFLSAD
jgi:hypothetical protein